MPMETRFYVPKLQAIKNIVAKPTEFRVVLPGIPNHPYFQSVPLPRDMDVAVAAKLAEISVEDFRSLNPSAHRPVLLAAGSPQILLPWEKCFSAITRPLGAHAWPVGRPGWRLPP
jgi:membrane-bound lytic murein transglycosylase D